MSKDKIDKLCVQYKKQFDIELFLQLVVFSARTLGVLVSEPPIDKIDRIIQRALKLRSVGPLQAAQNLGGNFAVLTYYLHHQLGDLLFYRPFIDGVTNYIDAQRDPSFSQEIASEKAIFLSMVYEPMRWHELLGKYEHILRLRDAQALFSDHDIPCLKTVRMFIQTSLKQECQHKLDVIIRTKPPKPSSKEHRGMEKSSDRVVLAKRLLSWLDNKTDKLALTDVKAIEAGALDDVTDRFSCLFKYGLK